MAPRIRYPTAYTYKSTTEATYNEGNELIPGTSVDVAGTCIFSGSKNTKLTTESGDTIEIVAQMIIPPTVSIPFGTKLTVAGSIYVVHDMTPTIDADGNTHHKTVFLRNAGGNT